MKCHVLCPLSPFIGIPPLTFLAAGCALPFLIPAFTHFKHQLHLSVFLLIVLLFFFSKLQLLLGPPAHSISPPAPIDSTGLHRVVNATNSNPFSPSFMAASSNARPQLTAQALILSVIKPTLQSNSAEFSQPTTIPSPSALFSKTSPASAQPQKQIMTSKYTHLANLILPLLSSLCHLERLTPKKVLSSDIPQS